jgi:hypothetical protein
MPYSTCRIGCEDRSIRVWSTDERREVAVWALHAAPPASLKWAPRRWVHPSVRRSSVCPILLAPTLNSKTCILNPGPMSLSIYLPGSLSVRLSVHLPAS